MVQCKAGSAFTLLFVVFSCFTLSTIEADESTARPAVEDSSPALEECRASVANYLLETPQPSMRDLIDQIWIQNGGDAANRTTEAGASIARSISEGVNLDLESKTMSWNIDGFSNENPEDRQNLATLIVNAYLESHVTDAGAVQQLKDRFQILPKDQSAAGADEKKSNPRSEVNGTELEKCRASVARYLLETSQPSMRDLIEQIWTQNGGNSTKRTTEAGAGIAQSIADGVNLDLESKSMSWKIDGFSNDNPEDRARLATLIVNAYLESHVTDAGAVQQLKDGFQILPKADPLDPFLIPVGLSMPLDELLSRFGYNPHHRLDQVPFPLTPNTCMELAALCFRSGLYFDALAIANFGLKTSRHPKLLFIRGASEMATGDTAASLLTIRELRQVHRNPHSTHEFADVNGPIAVRFLFAYKAYVGKPNRTLARSFK